jgi:hypothetical protein
MPGGALDCISDFCGRFRQLLWVLSNLRSLARDIPNESGLVIDTHLGLTVGKRQEE